MPAATLLAPVAAAGNIKSAAADDFSRILSPFRNSMFHYNGCTMDVCQRDYFAAESSHSSHSSPAIVYRHSPDTGGCNGSVWPHKAKRAGPAKLVGSGESAEYQRPPQSTPTPAIPSSITSVFLSHGLTSFDSFRPASGGASTNPPPAIIYSGEMAKLVARLVAISRLIDYIGRLVGRLIGAKIGLNLKTLL